MKLALIGNFTEIYHEEGKARALQKLGHDVYRFREKGFNDYDKKIIINEIRPDAVIYTKLRIKKSIDLVRDLKNNNIKTISWFPDYCNVGEWGNTAFRINDVQNCALCNSDLVLIPDSVNKLRWAALGVNQHLLRQGISEEFCYIAPPLAAASYDVLFVGTVMKSTLYSYRFELVNFLKTKYKDRFLHVGANNPSQVRNSDLNNLISSSKIIIADSPHHPGLWSNRVYETVGRGGFCLHSNVEGLGAHFDIGTHLDVYEHRNYNDLGKKIDFYLQNEEKRNLISQSGFKHVKSNHTLLHRSAKVIEKIRELMS